MKKEKTRKPKVKICGITTLEDARFASGALADYLGFIFYEESPRYVEPAKAGAIINWIEGPLKVGVFVNQPLDDVNEIALRTGVDIIQLHGDESPGYCDMMNYPVIKALHITDDTKTDDLKMEMDTYMNCVDYFLFDTKINGLYGGTGQTFNWKILKDLTMGKPFFLSGGLNSNNVAEAIKVVTPDIVDLSSGLEESPGLKDFDKIEEFFDVMRDIREEQT